MKKQVTKTTKAKSYKTEGINKFYTRLNQSKYRNTYYIEPKDTCPVDVLNCRDRFVVVTFDKNDDYIVIDDNRYYLTHKVAIKGTNKINPRVAIVDIDELEKSKPYKFDEKYKRENTKIFNSFDELRNLADQQYKSNGIPYVKQVAIYDKDQDCCQYIYEPSFEIGLTA